MLSLGLAVMTGSPTPALEPWVPAAVSGSPVRYVGFARAHRCCERLGGCLGAANSRAVVRPVGKEETVGHLSGCSEQTLLSSPVLTAKSRSQDSHPAYGRCIHPSKSLPRLGRGTGAASSPGSYWEAPGGYLSITEALLPPVPSAAAPPWGVHPHPSSSQPISLLLPGGCSRGVLGQGHPGGWEAHAGCVQASEQACPQIPAELQSSSALVWVKEN